MSQGYGQALQAAGQQQALTAQAGKPVAVYSNNKHCWRNLGQTAGGLTAQQQADALQAGQIGGER